MEQLPYLRGAVAFALVFTSMISSTLLVPAVRPFFAAFHGGAEGPMHAFMSLNMLGAVVGAPLLGSRADRLGDRRVLVAVLALTDAVLLFLCSLPIPTALVLLLRTLQGAANVGALSVLMGALGRARADEAGAGSMGLIGAAVIAAVAAGTPLGTLLMGVDPALPLQVGAACALVAGFGAWWLLPRDAAAATTRRSPRALMREHPGMVAPALWMAAERFTVGCFVVTFSLHAHHVLGLGDRETGVLYAHMLLPFALFTWPMGRLAARAGGAIVVAGGAVAYGAAFLALGFSRGWALQAVLVVAGVASAALYAGALQAGAEAAPRDRRITAMGLLNAAGTLGMLVGTALAGIVSGILRSRGVDRGTAYAIIFGAAGATLWLLLPTLRSVTRSGTPAAASTAPR